MWALVSSTHMRVLFSFGVLLNKTFLTIFILSLGELSSFDASLFSRDMSAPQTGGLTFLWRKLSSQRLFIWLRNAETLPSGGMLLIFFFFFFFFFFFCASAICQVWCRFVDCISHCLDTEGLVSNETAVLCQWGVKTNVWFYQQS